MRNNRPVIGILGSHEGTQLRIPSQYMDAVWRGGGLGVPLVYTTDPEKVAGYVETCDGFLFSGGVDIDPRHYGEEKQDERVEIDPERDAFELAMFPEIYKSRKPILGICRGIQLLNVALGGSLYQHMDGHRQTVPETERPQAVRLPEESLLRKICGKQEIYVNSFHHQCVKDLAPGLVADGLSEEGYIEALHDPRHPFLLAVQFHPEIYNHCPDDDHSRALFVAFVEACRG